MSVQAAAQEVQETQTQQVADVTIPQLVIEKNILLKALGHVQSVVEKRHTIPVLSNVKLDVTGQTLGLTATDMEISVSEVVSAQVMQEGSLTVPAHMLFEIVKKLPDGAEIVFGEDDKQQGRISLVSGKSKFSLPFLPASDFPLIQSGNLPCSFTMDAKDLRILLEKTRFASSTEETRYYLNGVFIGAEDDKLISAATDGHRMAKFAVTLPKGANKIPGIIIPRKTVFEIGKLVEDFEEQINVSVSDTKIQIISGKVTLLSKLIDGVFPDYRNVLPERTEHIMEVNVSEFTHAVDRVATVSSEKTRAIKCLAADNSLTLSAANEQSGSGKEVIEVIYDSIQIDHVYNSRYLLEILAHIEDDTARVMFTGQDGPVMVFDDAYPDAVYVIMSMRM